MMSEQEIQPLEAIGSPELQLLLYCAHVERHPATRQAITALAQTAIDWSALVGLARRHALLPLLFRSLSELCPEAVPSQVWASLRQQFQAIVQRNLFLSTEVVKLVQGLADAGIPSVPFKGPTLAAAAYQDLGLRQFNDLDLLIHPQALTQARDWFLSQGYEMKFEYIRPTSAQIAKFLSSHQVHGLVRECTYPFVHPQRQVLVELHWAPMPNIIPFALAPQVLWQHLTTVTIAQTPIPHFSPEATLMLLCAHGAKDCWVQLARLSDVARVVHQYPAMDWGWILQQSTELGIRRLVLLGLMLADRLLSTQLPQPIQQAMALDPKLAPLCGQVQAQLTGSAPYTLGAVSPFHLAVRERWQDRWSYRWRTALRPTTADWLMLPLARFPLGFYTLLRPLRLLSQRLH